MTSWYHFYNGMEQLHDENAYFAGWQQNRYKWRHPAPPVHPPETDSVEMEPANAPVWCI